MGLLTILDYATAVAVGGATSQQAQLEALLAPFGASPITARLENASGTHLRTLTVPLPSIEATTPRRFVLGAHLADAAVSVGTPARWVMRTAGGLAVFALTAGVSGADVNHIGAIKTLCTPTLQGVVVSAAATLPPTSPPAWLAGASIGQWVDIPGTANPPGSLNLDAFCDFTLRPSDSTLIAVASGGHNDGPSNAAASVNLEAGSPGWTLRKGSTWNGTEANVLYYADGTPASRHTYHYTHYIEGLNAVLLAGCNFAWGGSTPQGPGMDLFSLTSNDYLPRFTYPDITPWPSAGYGIVQDGVGNIWTQAGYRFNVSTQTWSKPGSGSLLNNFPAAYDSIRDRIFALQWGTGSGGGSGVSARELDPSTGNSRDITINSSAALTQFAADTPAYGGMAFNPLDGKFYFMHSLRMQTFYVVTPNAGTAWDMALWTPTGTPLSNGGILNKRLLYVPRLQGFVAQRSKADNMKFVRVA